MIGLPPGSAVCPECGGSLSGAAFAKAAARRMAQNTWARCALLASPGVGLVMTAIVAGPTGSPSAAAATMLGVLWAGAGVAIYVTASRSRPRRALRAVLYGLPLGVAYFAAVVGVTVVLILVIATIIGSPVWT